MNEQTSKLIEQLAQKLGTTSKYLWNILLHQAPISATSTLVLYAITIIIGIIAFKIHKKLLAPIPNDTYNDNLYEKYEIGAVLPMVLVALIIVIMTICCLIDFDNIVTGYFNPEYWALNKVLDTLK